MSDHQTRWNELREITKKHKMVLITATECTVNRPYYRTKNGLPKPSYEIVIIDYMDLLVREK